MTKQEKLNKIKSELLQRLKDKEIWYENGSYVIKER